ncbi:MULTISPECIES: hypothetical protein [Caballeronia]|uniref:hypothetical protein n=1 Tax=Caballeronia TaxID=1827195 RepID=UPI00158E49D8|nr:MULTISPECIES: hypothetical protein [Caballeronia]MCG7403217.1 hypothetical protein [Caballeronia zhejiangensis]MCI1044971.1 hypothetical protein [Caballeronia zhejiangensis]
MIGSIVVLILKNSKGCSGRLGILRAAVDVGRLEALTFTYRLEPIMTIPQNEPGTDVVDTDKAKQPDTKRAEPKQDLPLTEADDGNTRTPPNPS